MKQTLTLLAALTFSAASSIAQVGIGTTLPQTTLHLYSETEYPVLRLERGSSTPEPESGRVEWVYRDGTTDKGYSLHAADGELRVSKLTDNTLVQQDYPSVSLEPESVGINLQDGPGQVTSEVNLSVNGSIAAGNRTINTDYSMPQAGDTEDYVILADASAGNITVTLCSAVGQKGRLLIIKKIEGPYVITIDGYQLEQIDGSLNYILSSLYQYVSIQSNGTNWFVIGNN